MKRLKYIFYILTTLLFVGCNDDEGYVYKNLYEIVFTTNQPIVVDLNTATQATYNINKIAGKDNFYEFTIDATANFNNFAINGQTFVASEFVRIDSFTDNNVITFTPLTAGNQKLPVKIKYCGLVLNYDLEVTSTSTPGLVLAVPAMKVELLNSNTLSGIPVVAGKSVVNKDSYNPVFKFEVGDITLTDNLPGKTWELSITSKLDNIDKITYRGVDYQPGEYFEFDPAYADELVIIPKNTVTYGEEVFTFKAKNSDGTLSNVVEVPFLYYANITSNISGTNPLQTNMYFDLEAVYTPLSNPANGGSVADQKLVHTQQLRVNGNGAAIKSIVLYYEMSGIAHGTTNIVATADASYDYLSPGQTLYEFIMDPNLEVPLGPLADYAVSKSEVDYSSIITLTVTNEFNEIEVFTFTNTGTFLLNPYKFTGGI